MKYLQYLYIACGIVLAGFFFVASAHKSKAVLSMDCLVNGVCNDAGSGGGVGNSSSTNSSILAPLSEYQIQAYFNASVQAKATPGRCKTEQDCDVYCSGSEHRQECANFFTSFGATLAGQSGQSPRDTKVVKEQLKACNQYLQPQKTAPAQGKRTSSTKTKKTPTADPLAQFRNCYQETINKNKPSNSRSSSGLSNPADFSAKLQTCYEKYKDEQLQACRQQAMDSLLSKPKALNDQTPYGGLGQNYNDQYSTPGSEFKGLQWQPY